MEKWKPGRFCELKEDESVAFETLKSKLIEPAVQVLTRREGRYTIDTDECEKQMGFVQLQEQPEGPKKPISYWKHKLNETEKSYDTTHREFLAVISELLTLRPSLKGIRLNIRTEQDALRWILTMAYAPGKLARSRLRLSEY